MTSFRGIFIFLLLLLSNSCYGQNLMPNPGFEIHDTCPNSTSQVNYCRDWFQVANTPDYFNSCFNLNTASVPYNYFGYQPAHSGCAYCGMYTKEPITPDFREYMQAQLTTPLTIGQKYFISFYINLLNGYPFSAGTGNFGCKLTTYAINYTAMVLCPETNNAATFYTDSIVTDTVGWTQINGSFIADSAYTYIAFGNFFVDSLTPYIIVAGAPIVFSYYYIDDVCLSADSTDCISVTNVCYTPNGIDENPGNNLHVFPNPFTDKLTFEMNKMDSYEICLYDIASRKMVKEYFSEQVSFNTAGFPPGVYFYEIRNKRGILKTGKVMKE